MLVVPAVILLNVGARDIVLVSGIDLAWYVCMPIVMSVHLSALPCRFTAAGVEYTSSTPLLGGSLVSLLITLVSDHKLQWTVG